MNSLRLITGTSLALLLTGCAVGPNFVPPNPGLPATSFFAGATHKPVVSTRVALEPVDPDWWALFRDHELTALERRVAATNLDVQTATLRLVESRYQRGVTASSLFPTLDDNGSYKRYQISNSVLEGVAGNHAAPQCARSPSTFGNRVSTPRGNSISGGMCGARSKPPTPTSMPRPTSGVARSSRRSPKWRATICNCAASNGKSRSPVTTSRPRAIFSTSPRIRQKTGVVTGLDVENAAAQVDSVRATIPDLERQQSEAINALSLLLDAPPGGLAAELTPPGAIPPPPPRIPVGIPSDLARRRPDIREAEAQLHEATADIGVAVAAFYPTVTLNGTVGFQALDLKQLWKGASLEYNLGPSVTMPLFEGGKLTSTARAAHRAAAGSLDQLSRDGAESLA